MACNCSTIAVLIYNVMRKNYACNNEINKIKMRILFIHLGTPRNGSGVTDEFRTTPEVFAGTGDTMLLGWPWRYPAPAGLCLYFIARMKNKFISIILIFCEEQMCYLIVGLGWGATNDPRWYWAREAAAGGEGSGGKPFSNVVGWLLELEWGMYVLFTRCSRLTLGTGAGAPGTSECDTLGWEGFTVGCILFTENNEKIHYVNCLLTNERYKRWNRWSN